MSKILSEAKACLVLAIPLAAAQLAQASTNFFDTVMMGWLGSQTIAAGALGAMAFATLILICTGIITAVGAIAALTFGAGDFDRLSRLTSQGIWLSIALSLPSMLLVWYFSPILILLGQEPTNVALADTYLKAIVWGFPAALIFAVFRNVVSALNRPRPIMVIIIVGVLLNIFGNYVLMFGKFGLPAFGLAGIGWSSTISLWVTLAAIIGFIQFDKELKAYHLFRHLHQFDSLIFWEIIHTGWPIGVLLGVEIGLFALTALLMGYLGTVTLAAHQIALQTAAMTYMVPVGISAATTIRVGQLLGRNDPISARLAGYVGIGISAIFMAIMALIFWTHPDKIVSLYLDVKNPDNFKVVELAISLLGIATMFQIFDGIQVTAAGALRGLKDTRIPMFIGIFSYWCVGLFSGYILGLRLGWGGMGLWLGLVFGLAFAAVILTWRFHRVTLPLVEKEKLQLLESIE
ncbi:MAG TPA: MATE family efflux transporter [Leptolyngbyaceae cyanobacterium]